MGTQPVPQIGANPCGIPPAASDRPRGILTDRGYFLSLIHLNPSCNSLAANLAPTRALCAPATRETPWNASTLPAGRAPYHTGNPQNYPQIRLGFAVVSCSPAARVRQTTDRDDATPEAAPGSSGRLHRRVMRDDGRRRRPLRPPHTRDRTLAGRCESENRAALVSVTAVFRSRRRRPARHERYAAERDRQR